MNRIEVPKRYLAMSRTVVNTVPAILGRRGLEAPFSDWLLTSYQGQVWLIGVLDVSKLGRLERYTGPAILHHLSTGLKGLPVLLSNSNGLRYIFLLTPPPRLPRRVELPNDVRRGTVVLGIGSNGTPVVVRWNDLGHVLVAGMTRSGKSNFLRLLTWQMLREGGQLLLADLDGVTFPMLEGHPALLAPVARDPDDVRELVGRALGECDRRSDLYANAPGYPETLVEYNAQTSRETLAPLLVVLDEFNATVLAQGGPRGAFAGEVASLAWRGLKFGVHLVFAAQDFSKAVVGRVRDQVRTAVCFRARSPETARAVGCSGAQRIPESIPGRAITDRWGLMQAYYLDKDLLIDGTPRPPLVDRELALVAWALEENEGYLPRVAVEERGWSHRDARRLLKEWEHRGWLEKDPNRGNSRKVTIELEALAAQVPNPPRPAQPPNPAQGGKIGGGNG
jgi:hypothetical protein